MEFLKDNWHFISIVITFGGIMLTIIIRLTNLLFGSQQKRIDTLEQELKKSNEELIKFKEQYLKEIAERKTTYEFLKENESLIRMVVGEFQKAVHLQKRN